jgi:hypothetical protein
VTSIREGVLRVIEDKDYRQQLIQEGLRNAQRFIPENIALQYLECYRQVLKD